MLAPLLRTKTTIPPLSPRLIQRARLLEQIDDGMRRALTLVIAPAGFGKTTLLAAWAGSGRLPVAWLALQPNDRPPERFLAYLIQSLQTISPRLGQTSLALLRGRAPEGALFALLNDLAEVESDIALVLDDYHSVDSPEIAQMVSLLLEHRPATFHLVIGTRVAPSFSLARLRALAQVTEIDAADLRFSLAEQSDFLQKCMGIQPGAVQSAELDRSTEGWAVGLQLAGLALARQPGDWRLPVGREYIFDYLAKEVLQREPANVQDFLTKTALPDRFCLELCQAILAIEQGGAQPEDAPALLAYLERANLFLVPLDSSGTWFRYHALFTEFLRRQLSSQQVEPLYRAASQWFEEYGLLDDAIHSATHAGDFDRTASLIETHYLDLLQRGEQAALSEWLNALPAAVFEQRPRLWLAKGWVSIIAIDSDQAEACAQKAESAIQAGEPARSLGAEANSLKMLARIFAGKAISAGEILSTTAALAEQDDFLHLMLHFNLGLHYVLLGETSLAVEAFNETLRLSQTASNPLVTIIAQVQLGETRQLRGALGLAERAFQQAIHYAKDALGEQTFLLGMPYVSYAELLREQNRFEEATHYAELGIAYCQIWQPAASMDGQIALARLRAAQGRWDEAFAHIERAFQVTEASVSILDDTLVAIHKVRLALLRGDLPRAARWIEMYDFEKSSAAMYHLLAELAQLVLLRARVMELEGGIEPAASASAADALAALIAEAENGERVSRVIEALILRAYALHAAACPADAAESLSRALALGAQGGYVRIFADEGSRLLRLLEQYHNQIHAPQTYFQDILTLLRSEATRLVQTTSPDQLFAEGLTPLTRRELDILELMAAGKSNQEIAAECVLALNTVKKHVANILSKMGVANRTQAVMLARKLGWLK